MMRLLALPEPVKTMVQDGALTAGHARALLTAPDPVEMAREVVIRGLNVRQTEDLMRGDQPKAKKGKGANGAAGSAPAMKDVDLINLEEEISARIGLKVAINPQGQRGTITIHYQTLDQLDDVLHRLGGEE
nr:hypothetical protein [Methylobacterium sp. B34]